MALARILSSTLVLIPSCTEGNIIQYAVLSALALYVGLRAIQPLFPSARMVDLEKIVAETLDILHSANEEHLLRSREFMLQVQLRLSRVNMVKSTLRSNVLAFEFNYPTRECLHRLRRLFSEIEGCKREAKQIKVAILTEIEKERREVYSASIEDMAAILASGRSVSAYQFGSVAASLDVEDHIPLKDFKLAVIQREGGPRWLNMVGSKRYVVTCYDS
ncbi:hypothetical protein R3P38DRAFT_2821085 [Favolaschia claudopus]|uniref:Uncharacterized protein n=1 Tax=Favolaschia claudopus TaxID=2862362 RepID=A0AAW0EIJ1_9AGAR